MEHKAVAVVFIDVLQHPRIEAVQHDTVFQTVLTDKGHDFICAFLTPCLIAGLIVFLQFDVQHQGGVLYGKQQKFLQHGDGQRMKFAAHIELTDFFKRQVGDRQILTGGAFGGAVVVQYKIAVLRHANIGFDHVGAGGNGSLKGLHCVFIAAVAVTTMSGYRHALAIGELHALSPPNRS